MRDVICIGSGFCALALFAGLAMAADRQVGVASCAGSTCHGATRAFADHPIRQDEYFVWQNQDRHSAAYRTLTTAPAAAIARRLGLGPAEQAASCLACHATGLGAEPPVARHRLEDGIACEACHGAAERWLTPHVRGYRSLADRQAAGLSPTWSLPDRARLCLGCHQGDAERPVSHALMAAGHPALLFELDTFMALMPPHHADDADYRARKPVIEPARQWLEGQLAAAEMALDRWSRAPAATGLFPDLALYDCDACHHPMGAARATAGRVPGQPIGTVPLADQSMVLLAAWLQAVDPALARRWQEGLARIYAQLADGSPATAIAAQRRLLTDPLRARAAGALGARELRGVLKRMLAAGAGPHGGDFRHAEQVAMASKVFAAALRDRGEVPRGFEQASQALYAQVDSRAAFDPRAWREACRRLDRLL